MELEVLPTTIAALLTLVSPYITALFVKTEMKAVTKTWIAFGISAVIALVYVFMQGGFNNLAGPEEYLAALGVAYGLGQLVYNSILKKSAKTVEANYGVTSAVKEESAGKVEVVETTNSDGSEALVAVPKETEGFRGDVKG